MAKSISLQKNERKKYNKLVAIITFVFLVCFGSRLIVPPMRTEKSTQIGEEVKQDTRNYQLIERSYVPEKNQLKALIYTPVNSSNVLDELQVSVKKKSTDKTKYAKQLKKLTESIYLLEVNQLDDKWKELDVTIYPKGHDIETLTKDQKFHFVQKELPENNALSQGKSSDDYEKIVCFYQLKEGKKEQKQHLKKQQGLKKDVSKLEQVNADLKTTLDDKTKTEQEELNQTIKQNESKKETVKKEIEDEQEVINELKAKQEKLEKRVAELEK